MTAFEPQPLRVVEAPQQLKAFTDPLRLRILARLVERPATNQQLADTLGEAQPKVLYHLRFLHEAGLVRLVETQVKGGNVEKYYRAIARTFSLHPSAELFPAITGSQFEVVLQEVAASAVAWPDHPPQFLHHGRRLTPTQATAFYDRLLAFLAAEWAGAVTPSDGAADEVGPEETPALMRLAVAFYRDPQGAPDADSTR